MGWGGEVGVGWWGWGGVGVGSVWGGVEVRWSGFFIATISRCIAPHVAPSDEKRRKLGQEGVVGWRIERGVDVHCIYRPRMDCTTIHNSMIIVDHAIEHFPLLNAR